MRLFSLLKTQYRYAFVYNAYPKINFIKSLFLFPYYYYVKRMPSLPLAFTILLTLKCNFKCVMCSFDKLVNKKDCKELSLNEIKKFISENSKYEPGIMLSGGEPLLREDIFDIIGFVKAKGLICGTCTNGYLLDEPKISSLTASGIDYVIFSIHGTRKAHNLITGKPDSFDRVIKALKNYINKKSVAQKAIVNCAITVQNINCLESLIKTLEPLNIDLLIFEHLSFTTENDLSKHRLSGVYSSCEVVNHFKEEVIGPDFFKGIELLKQSITKYKTKVIFKPDLSSSEIKGWYRDVFDLKRKCLFLWGSLYIHPDGSIYPCQFINESFGNIASDNLIDIWYGKKYMDFRNKVRKGLLPFCSRCCKL